MGQVIMRIIELTADDGSLIVEIDQSGAGDWGRCYVVTLARREFMGAEAPRRIANWLLDALLDRTMRRQVADDPDWRVVMGLFEAHRFLLDCKDPISGFHHLKWVEGDGTGRLVASLMLGPTAQAHWIAQLIAVDKGP
jgi:hypothetical protein